MNKFLKTIESTYLCIKYPFLYPRNRFTGLHHTNWKLHEYMFGKGSLYQKKEGGIYNKAYENICIHLVTPDPNGNHFRNIKYRKSFWWAIWFHIVNFIYQYVDPFFHCIPSSTEWDMMPIGWKKAFGDQYLKELKAQLKKDKMLYSWRIVDIKEKYGTLRLECTYGTDELYHLINKYEHLSYYTCIICGAPATKLSGGWICPYCDEHIGDSFTCASLDKNGKWKYDDFEYNDDNDIDDK